MSLKYHPSELSYLKDRIGALMAQGK